MEPLAARFLETLSSGAPDLDALSAAGEPEPGPAADAFAAAMRQPELANTCAEWVPALLRCARPGFGARCLAELAERSRADASGPLDLAETPSLPLVLGSSNFLARLLLSHPDWVAQLAGALPGPPDRAPLEPGWPEIRLAKYRGLLRIAARDLVSRPFAQSLRELSDLADGCLVAALECASREVGQAPPALLALGKLGGRELNFSSDVDLLFVSRSVSGEAALHEREAHSRLINRVKSGLESRTADGFGYRVDLDLRPEGRAGVLVNPVEAALGYYEAFGAEWERQMLIRLRPLAGPSETAAQFMAGITPFVFRRAIDPTAMRSVRDMKARIEDERRRAGRDLDADLKEGPGGIRDVEFLVQSFQLFYGGRHPELRTGNVYEALDALGRLGLLPEAVISSLLRSYTWLRRSEHALQLVEEQQTARFPRARHEQIALARRLGYAEPEGDRARERLLDDWTAVRSETRSHFEALVLGDAP